MKNVMIAMLSLLVACAAPAGRSGPPTTDAERQELASELGSNYVNLTDDGPVPITLEDYVASGLASTNAIAPRCSHECGSDSDCILIPGCGGRCIGDLARGGDFHCGVPREP